MSFPPHICRYILWVQPLILSCFFASASCVIFLSSSLFWPDFSFTMLTVLCLFYYIFEVRTDRTTSSSRVCGACISSKEFTSSESCPTDRRCVPCACALWPLYDHTGKITLKEKLPSMHIHHIGYKLPIFRLTHIIKSLTSQRWASHSSPLSL